MTKTIDLLCLGNPCADLVVRCERLPAWDDKCRGEAIGGYAGGSEANVACAASRLGWCTAVFGEVGDDPHAASLLDAFAKDGVSTRWIHRRAHAASAMTLVLLSPEAERSIVWVPMPTVAWPPESLDAALAASRVVYTMPYDAGDLAALHEAARRHGCEVAIDVEREAARQPALLNGLLRACDIAFFNESGFTTAFGKPPDEATLRALVDSVPAHTVVVTLGAKGAVAADEQGFATAPARPVNVLDTTGAGDSFNAAFLVARDRGMDLHRALAFACAAASQVVAALGARSAMATFDEVTALLDA